jgi:gliding motility-associated-like protein
MHIIAEKKIQHFLSNKKVLLIILFLLILIGTQSFAQPVFTAPGGSGNTTLNISENTLIATTLVATPSSGAVTYQIVDGNDPGRFNLDPNTGVLTFKIIPDYERPSDFLGDRRYIVRVQATDNNGSVYKTLTINILNVNENPDPPRNFFIVAQNQSNQLYWTASAGGGITEYRIYRSEDSVTFNLLGATASTSFTDNALANGKFYFYRVTAWNGTSESTFTDTDGSTPRETQISTYLHFDGNADYLVVDDTIHLMGINYLYGTTLECWVRFATIPSAKTTILSKDYNANSSLNLPFKYYEIYYDAGKIYFTYNGGSLLSPTASSYTTSTPTSFALQANKWYHLTAVYSYADKRIKLYVNGSSRTVDWVNSTTVNILENSISGINPNFPLNTRLIVGATTATVSPFTYSNYFNGDIAEVRYWNTELDSNTIKSNMYAYRRGDEANLLGLWHLDTLRNGLVYNFDNLNFNAKIYGDVCAVYPRKDAINDNASTLASNSVYLDVRKNDQLFLPASTPKSVVLTKIVSGPSHGTASVVNRDSILYNPGCFLGTDTITYLICDTTFFNNPYQFADTAMVIINCYDNVAPVFTQPANITISCDASQLPSNTGNVTAADMSDNCAPDANLTVTYSDASTQNADPANASHYNYTLTRTWRVTDVAGNYTEHAQTITVQDVTAPVFTQPANTTISCDASQLPSNTGNVTAADMSDNCASDANLTVTYSDASTQDADPANASHYNYTLTRTWRVTDVAGNYTEHAQTITVQDVISPSIICTGNKMVSTDIDMSTYTHIGAGWEASGSDNCSVPIVTYRWEGLTTGTGTTLNGVSFNTGITTVWCVVRDASNNSDSCSFTITVSDNQNPVLACGTNKSINTGSGECTFTYTGVGWNASATDNCAVTSLYYRLEGVTTGTGTSLSGVVFSHGTTTVWWIAEDAAGNKDSCSFTVLVWDNFEPSVTCTTNKTVSANNGVCTYTHSGTLWDATATDNCTVDSLTYRLEGVTTDEGTTLDGVIFNKGITTVWWRAFDATGNSDSCSFTVTVSDNEAPNITSTGNKMVSTDMDMDTYTHIGTGWDAAGTDNCGTVNLNYRLEGITTGTGTTLDSVSFEKGITIVWWIATDADGNKDSTRFVVTVNDSQIPTISCISDQNANTDFGTCTYTHNGTVWDATGTDNTPGWVITYALTGATSGTGNSLNGVTFSQGITTVTWTNTDASSNSVQCSFNVTVTDGQSPAITAPLDVTVNTDAGLCSASGVTIGVPLSSDNCGIASLSNDAPSVFPADTTIVTWTVTDIHGNIATATQRVIVVDNQNPSITAPANVNAKVDPGTHFATGVVLGVPVTSDNCGIAAVINDAPASFPAGVTTVTWTITDVHGNTNIAVQTVTVIDNQPPVITSPDAITTPENVTLVTTIAVSDPDITDIAWTFAIIGGADASRLQINPTNGDLSFNTAPDFEIPTDVNSDNIYEVDVTATDINGLSDTITLFVTVINVNELPVDIILSNSSVNEYQPVGVLIGILSTMDPDIGDSHTYTLSGTDATHFLIDGDTLRTADIFNYTVRSSFNIIIRTTDSQGAFFEEPFTITITNINEAPVILSGNNNPADTLTFTAYEGEVTNVCLSVSDPDNDIVSITALSSLDGQSNLSVSGDVISCFNYLSAAGFLGSETLLVRVSDNGTPILYDSIVIVMNVLPRFIFSQVISPNNDNINDYWSIGGLERYPDNKVTVFSRWGDVVYKASGYDNVNVVWRGELYNGQKLTNNYAPDGTYFYIIELGDGSKLTGFVVLKR